MADYFKSTPQAGSQQVNKLAGRTCRASPLVRTGFIAKHSPNLQLQGLSRLIDRDTPDRHNKLFFCLVQVKLANNIFRTNMFPLASNIPRVKFRTCLSHSENVSVVDRALLVRKFHAQQLALSNCSPFFSVYVKRKVNYVQFFPSV